MVTQPAYHSLPRHHGLNSSKDWAHFTSQRKRIKQQDHHRLYQYLLFTQTNNVSFGSKERYFTFCFENFSLFGEKMIDVSVELKSCAFTYRVSGDKTEICKFCVTTVFRLSSGWTNQLFSEKRPVNASLLGEKTHLVWEKWYTCMSQLSYAAIPRFGFAKWCFSF